MIRIEFNNDNNIFNFFIKYLDSFFFFNYKKKNIKTSFILAKFNNMEKEFTRKYKL